MDEESDDVALCEGKLTSFCSSQPHADPNTKGSLIEAGTTMAGAGGADSGVRLVSFALSPWRLRLDSFADIQR